VKCDNDDIWRFYLFLVKTTKWNAFLLRNLNVSTKLKVLYSFFSSLYGAELWDLSRCDFECVNVVWRKALKRVWSLPWRTHSNILILCYKSRYLFIPSTKVKTIFSTIYCILGILSVYQLALFSTTRRTNQYSWCKIIFRIQHVVYTVSSASCVLDLYLLTHHGLNAHTSVHCNWHMTCYQPQNNNDNNIHIYWR